MLRRNSILNGNSGNRFVFKQINVTTEIERKNEMKIKCILYNLTSFSEIAMFENNFQHTEEKT